MSAEQGSAPPPAGSEAEMASPPGTTTIGSLADLVRIRESKGFSASLVSSRLRLAPRQIAALEAGEWAALPGRTFIRSSLRSYGRLVEADVAPLLEAIESQLPGGDVLKPDSELKRPMPREGALGFGGSGSGSRWVWMLLLVAGIIALAFFYGGGATLLNRSLPAHSGPAATGSRSAGDAGQRPPEAVAAPSDRGAIASGSRAPSASATSQATPPSTASANASASGSSSPAATGAAASPPAGSSPAQPSASSAAGPLSAAPASPPGATASTTTARGSMAGVVPSPATSSAAPSPLVTLPAPASPGPGAAASAAGTPSAAMSASTPSTSPQSLPGSQTTLPPAQTSAGSSAAPGSAATAPAPVAMSRATGGASGPGVPLNPLVMRFPADSWIEVRDGSGAVLVTGTQSPGTVREVSGELPLSLIIGNAGGVTVTWRGAPIDLAPHMRQGIARFRIE